MLVFNNMWSMNFQIFKLVLGKAEESEIKLPTSLESSKKQESSRKYLLLFCWLPKMCDCMDHNKLEILKEMRIPDHLTSLLRYLYADQETTVKIRHGTTDWFQIGKGVRQGCILSPSFFNLYAEYIMWNAGLDKIKLESRFLGEISIMSDTQMTPPLWQKGKKN